MQLTNLVWHMPKYICTTFQVIWFTFVAANSKNSQIRYLFYLENRFMGQKYLQIASKLKMPLTNLVGHMPKYICTNLQVIWFTFVATNTDFRGKKVVIFGCFLNCGHKCKPNDLKIGIYILWHMPNKICLWNF